MTTKTARRLWRAIDNAESELLAKERETDESFDDAVFNAASIRAIRDWLVPEEEPLDPIWFGSSMEHNYNFRQQLRTLLTSEADHAEHYND
jgi:hypothetical protein